MSSIREMVRRMNKEELAELRAVLNEINTHDDLIGLMAQFGKLKVVDTLLKEVDIDPEEVLVFVKDPLRTKLNDKYQQALVKLQAAIFKQMRSDYERSMRHIPKDLPVDIYKRAKRNLLSQLSQIYADYVIDIAPTHVKEKYQTALRNLQSTFYRRYTDYIDDEALANGITSLVTHGEILEYHLSGMRGDLHGLFSW